MMIVNNNKTLGDSEDGRGLFDLSGRVALVTGGASWLGEPMSRGLAESGAHVIVVGRTLEPLQVLVSDLADAGHSAEACSMDIRDEAATVALIQHITDKHGRLDILVNNASAGYPGEKGLDAPEAAFADSTDIHLTAAWRLIKGTLPLFRNAVAACGDASIINISSMYGQVSPDPRVYAETGQPPNPPYYGAAKAGLIQLTRWLSTNLGPDGIRVNSISPGPFPQWNARERAPDFVEKLDRKTALGRVGERHEVKGVAVFLASHEASYVTGTDIRVDGGWMSW